MTYQERQSEIDRINTDSRNILATPLISEGAISSTQICRMGKRERDQWQKNTMLKMDLLYKIRCLEKSDEQIEAAQQKAERDRNEGELLQVNSRIQLIDGLGCMSHKKNGKLRDTFQREMIELEQRKDSLLRLVYPLNH